MIPTLNEWHLIVSYLDFSLFKSKELPGIVLLPTEEISYNFDMSVNLIAQMGYPSSIIFVDDGRDIGRYLKGLSAAIPVPTNTSIDVYTLDSNAIFKKDTLRRWDELSPFLQSFILHV